MRIIAKRTLREFWEKHPRGEQPLRAWYAEAKNAEWRTPLDVKAKYGNASIIGNNRVVFNIHGNDYRLVIKFHYNTGIGFVRFIDTHEEYDKIDAEVI
jgi:mRNA interferase HigB